MNDQAITTHVDNPKPSVIGVLALQGAFREHIRSLQALGADTVELRRPEQLEGISGLVIPGGESTTIGKLMISYELLEPLRELGLSGLPIFGTCAGLVMLAGSVCEGDQPLLGLMDVRVRRNAFGRQVNSFEAPLAVPSLGPEPFPGIFIRAPWIEAAGPGVEVLASLAGRAVAARQDNLLVAAFHPELTADLRLHRLFLSLTTAPPV